MKDMSNLELASRMLGHVERGFRKAHGPGLERLIALKGEHCAENLLYVRLHLLQASFALCFFVSWLSVTPIVSKVYILYVKLHLLQASIRLCCLCFLVVCGANCIAIVSKVSMGAANNIDGTCARRKKVRRSVGWLSDR